MPPESEPESITQPLLDRALALEHRGRFNEAVNVYEKLGEAVFGQLPEVPEGELVLLLGRLVEAIQSNDELLASFIKTDRKPAEGVGFARWAKKDLLKDLRVLVEQRLNPYALLQDAARWLDPRVEDMFLSPDEWARNRARQLQVYDRVIAICEKLSAPVAGEPADPRPREALARALYCKAFVLAELNRLEEARGVEEQLLARFDTAAEPSIRAYVEKVRVPRENRTPTPFEEPELHLVFLRGAMLLVKRSVVDWRVLQDEFFDFMTSLGPYETLTDVLEKLEEDWPDALAKRDDIGEFVASAARVMSL